MPLVLLGFKEREKEKERPREGDGGRDRQMWFLALRNL